MLFLSVFDIAFTTGVHSVMKVASLLCFSLHKYFCERCYEIVKRLAQNLSYSPLRDLQAFARTFLPFFQIPRRNKLPHPLPHRGVRQFKFFTYLSKRGVLSDEILLVYVLEKFGKLLPLYLSL